MNVRPAVEMTVTKKYDAAYSAGNPQWMPPRAEFEVFLRDDGGEGRVAELGIELSSGPAGIHRYFPFSVYVYVDDRWAAVLEFSKAFEPQNVTIDVPIGKPFTLTVISESSRPPAPGDTDQRDVALIFVGLHPGPVHPARLPERAALEPHNDFVSQKRVALVDRLPEPVFVVGPYRSGTSILTWALGQHPSIWPLPETHFVAMLGTGAVGGYWMGALPARSYFQLCDVSIEEYLTHVGCMIDDFMKKTTVRRFERSQFERLHPKDDSPQAVFNRDFEFARTLFGNKRRWVDGTPEHAGHMALLRRLFPAAKFVCTVRDPVDVIGSMINFGKVGGMTADLREATEMWQRMTEATILGARAFGSNAVTFVSYEAITASPDTALSGIFDFLGEPRFPKAADCYQHRINSSNLSEEQRAEARGTIRQHIANTGIPKLYEEVQTMIGASWSPDAQAFERLQAAHHDLVRRTLKGALPHVHFDRYL
jgi:hypothetical protein